MRTTVMAVLLIVVGLFGAGCSQISAQMNGDTVAASAPSPDPARPILVTREWGVVDGMLSVVVKNTTSRTLRSAEAVISARDENDVLVATSIEGPGGACCSVVDLPPGQQFGFYVDIGDDAAEVSHVDVAYRDVAWSTPTDVAAPADAERPLTAHPVSLDANDLGAVAVASVKTSVPMVAQASVQAFLDGPDGEFLAVVSGQWYCFAEGRHEIRMQLLHAVPAGTTVDRVVIHPVSDDPDEATPHCAGPAEPS